MAKKIVIPPRRNKRRSWPNVTVINPGKGLNNLISENLIKDEEASDLSNIMFVESGCVSKRNGHTVVGTGLSTNARGLGSYYTTSSKYLLTVDGTGLKYLAGSTWTAISGASFTNNLNNVFVQAAGDMYIWNGTDAARKLDSTLTLTAPTNTVRGSFAIYYAGKQIASGIDTQPNRLYISNSTDAGDFTVATGGTQPQPDSVTNAPGATVFAGTPGLSEANVIDVSKNDGDKITGLAKFQEKLIIFKERSIYSMTFDSSGLPVLQQINGSLGCVSHRSIDNVENDVFFLSRNGYYVLGNEPNYISTIRTNELSSRIHPAIETISPLNLSRVCSHFSGYVFYSSIPTGGTTVNNKTLTYDRRFAAWSVWTNTNANSFTEFIDANNVRHLYYAADDEAKVYEIDTSYSDNGSAISGYWTSKAFDLGDFSLYKQFIQVDLLFRQLAGSVTIELIADGNTTLKTSTISNISDVQGTVGYDGWGDPMWGQGVTTATSTSTGQVTQNVPYRIALNKTARTLKVKVSNANNNENFVLLGIKIYYRPYAPTKFPSSLKIS